MTKTIPRYTVRLEPSTVRSSNSTPDIKIEDTEKVLDAIKDYELPQRPAECLILLTIDVKGYLIGTSLIAQGVIDRSTVSPREILQTALLQNAESIIIVHNHVSHDTMPSTADKRFTKKLKTACEYLDIRLHDHIIVSQDDYLSFNREELL